MYDIEQDPVPTPTLPGEVDVALDPDELIDHLATDLVQHAFNCVRQFGDFHLALSGHPLFEPLYRRLMYDPQFRWLPWRRTHLWFVEDAAGAGGVGVHEAHLRETIGEHADIPDEQFHAIPLGAPDPAAAYEARVREVLGWRERGQDRFDYVLLALDAAGHAAGLFPGSPVLADPGRLYLPRGPGDAVVVSMTPAFIDAARLVAVAASGLESRNVIERIATDQETAATLPVAGIAPMEGELTWYLDLAACPVP